MVSARPKTKKQKRKTANLWASRQSRRLVKKMIGIGAIFAFLEPIRFFPISSLCSGAKSIYLLQHTFYS